MVAGSAYGGAAVYLAECISAINGCENLVWVCGHGVPEVPHQLNSTPGVVDATLPRPGCRSQVCGHCVNNTTGGKFQQALLEDDGSWFAPACV